MPRSAFSMSPMLLSQVESFLVSVDSEQLIIFRHQYLAPMLGVLVSITLQPIRPTAPVSCIKPLSRDYPAAAPEVKVTIAARSPWSVSRGRGPDAVLHLGPFSCCFKRFRHHRPLGDGRLGHQSFVVVIALKNLFMVSRRSLFGT